MAKLVNHKRYFNFISGINTESGYLTYPENTWSEGTNIIPAIDGSIGKRTAVDYESSHVLSPSLTTTSKENGAFIIGQWNAAGGDGAKNFSVVQLDHLVYFYAIYGETLSNTAHATVIDLATHKITGNTNIVGTAPISCASGNGYLVITSKDTEPLLVTYTSATDAITVVELTLYIRDFEGVNDTLTVDTKPATLSDLHKYNLLNQGWTSSQWGTYFTANAVYPSNAQIWTAGKDGSDVFSASLLDKQDFGNSPAPKGRFILDCLYRDRNNVSGISTIPLEAEVYAPTTTAFYAGRAWYAGITSAKISNWVLFSQVVDTNNKFGYCYQEADPTSEVISDLIASDGGVIPIQEVGTIIKLVPVSHALLVFADNGIWQISGGTDGFSADLYQVRKVSSMGAVGSDSIVDVESAVFFISTSGIYVVAPDQVSGSFTVQPVTDVSIKTLVSSIPATNKPYIRGIYHEEEKKIYFAYHNVATTNAIDRYKKNMFLVYDIRLKSFYTVTISEASAHPFICDMVLTKGRSSVDNSYTVVVGTDTVVVGADTVVAGLAYEGSKNKTIKLLTCVPQLDLISYKYTFSDFDSASVRNAPYKFRDWYSYNSNGLPYDSYIIGGYESGTDNFDKMKQPLYVSVFMKKTETGFDGTNPINQSSVLMQARWDWTEKAITGHFSTEREVYRHLRPYFPSLSTDVPSDGYPLLVTKNKIRGEGKAIAIQFKADPDKDMQIVGWEVNFIGNANV